MTEVHTGERKANAAQEMYEAISCLVGVIDDCNRGTEEGLIPRGILDRYDRAITLCRAALKRATVEGGCKNG